GIQAARAGVGNGERVGRADGRARWVYVGERQGRVGAGRVAEASAGAPAIKKARNRGHAQLGGIARADGNGRPGVGGRQR
nr:hypothetical protein [Tanacetum cinerariifolium]